jgi:hypothetical protein
LLTNDNALLKIPLLQSHSIPIIPTEWRSQAGRNVKLKFDRTLPKPAKN